MSSLTRRCAALGAALLIPALSGCVDSDELFGINDAGPIEAVSTGPELLLSLARTDTTSEISGVIQRDRVGLATTTLRELNGVERDVRSAPDGDTFAFVLELTPGIETSREIYIDSRSGAIALRRLTTDTSPDDRPAFSPDGTELVFASTRTGTGSRLYVRSTDGSGSEQLLTSDPFQEFEPDWSPIADLIVFVIADAGLVRPTIWTVRRNGSNLSCLTDGGSETGGDRDPTFSPDGQRVVFSRELPGGRRGLFSIGIDGSGLEQLTDPAGEDRRPRLSTDDEALFFLGTRPEFGDATPRVFTSNPDGSNVRLLSIAQRYNFTGLDVLPNPLGASPTLISVDARIEDAQLVSGLGSVVEGSVRDIESEDGRIWAIESIPEDGIDIAGVNVGIPLSDIPIDASSLRGLDLDVVVRVEPAMPGNILRLGLRNTRTGRTDTVIEREPSGVFERLSVSIGSLEHIDQDGVVRVILVTERPLDDIGELQIDSIDLSSVGSVPTATTAAPASRR
ncbi:MAG: hypothetical protein AAF196_11665 [Planctomycetota bacterium]